MPKKGDMNGSGSTHAANPSARQQATLALALPGSLIRALPSTETAAMVALQIARAAVLHGADELIIFEDQPPRHGKHSLASVFLVRALQWLETPPYLRQQLMGPQPDLSVMERLPPLQLPHHLSATQWSSYREGVVLKSATNFGSYIDAGLDRMVHVSQPLQQGRRVTLQLGAQPDVQFRPEFSETMINAQVVGSSAPQEAGQYWGYAVRLASSLSHVFKDTRYNKGYDFTVGVSLCGAVTDPHNLPRQNCKQALLVCAVGEHNSLEQALQHDPDWSNKDPQDIFSLYVNPCPTWGALRVIHTEDALHPSLAFITETLGWREQAALQAKLVAQAGDIDS